MTALSFTLHEDGIEGDYTAYVVSLDGNTTTDLDMNPPGIPYSQECVDLVIQLAKDGLRLDELVELILKARKACGKDV
jgi:hypothetical protein